MAKYTPQQVANYFIIKARGEDTPRNLTAMQIIKLVYFGYAWYLALQGEKLFDEKIEAWQYGPVIPSLYHEFKKNGSNPITNDTFAQQKEVLRQSDFIEEYEEETLGILSGVWDMYGNANAIELSEITHNNIAWRNAYTTGKNNALSDKDIFECAKRGIERYRGVLKNRNN